MSLKYSIIVLPSLFRKEKLESLLSTPTVSTELIAVDSDYNNDTKEYFRQFTDNFYRMLYLSSRSKDRKVRLQYGSLWNTGFLYAEGDWIICIKPGVAPSDELLHDIDLSVTEIESREQSKDFAILCGKSVQFLNDSGRRYDKLNDCAYLPFDVAVFPRTYLNIVNGYDELYDCIGSDVEDADKDFFCRLGKSSCHVYFDKKLSNSYDIYPSFRFQFTEPLINLFHFQRYQIKHGKVRAFNDFNYSDDNIKHIAFREPFELVGKDQFEILRVHNNEFTVRCDGKELRLNTYSQNDFVSSWISNVGYYEIGLLRELVKYTKNKVVFDIGAYIGTHSIYISKFGSPETVYAFEPDPKNFGLLKKNIEANSLDNVVPINKGVWEFDGTVSFRIADASNRGISKVDYAGDTTIQVVALDSFCGDGKCDCIKIDIEGNELKVLEGARKIITNSRPVLAIEVHGTKFEFPDWLLKLGYKVKKIRSGNMNHVVLVHGVHNSDYKPLEKVVEFPI